MVTSDLTCLFSVNGLPDATRGERSAALSKISVMSSVKQQNDSTHHKTNGKKTKNDASRQSGHYSTTMSRAHSIHPRHSGPLQPNGDFGV